MEEFDNIVTGLKDKLNLLMNSNPIKITQLPLDTPNGGVYIFSDKENVLYVGRTKRKIKDRILDHISNGDDCPFAWRLAREKSGKLATYKKRGSRTELLQNTEFRKLYEAQKELIRLLDVRYIDEKDSIKQALLEIYVHYHTKSTYNDFDTH